MRRSATLVAAVSLLAACGSSAVSSVPAPAATTGAGSGPASPVTGNGLSGTFAAVQTAVEGAGFICKPPGSLGGFRHVECPRAGVADIDIYGRADGSVAGIDAYAGSPMSADAMLGVLRPALDAGAGAAGAQAIASAVRSAGAPPTATTTVLPGSQLAVVVHGYADGSALASVAVLAPDLEAIWGLPRRVAPSSSDARPSM